MYLSSSQASSSSRHDSVKSKVDGDDDSFFMVSEGENDAIPVFDSGSDVADESGGGESHSISVRVRSDTQNYSTHEMERDTGSRSESLERDESSTHHPRSHSSTSQPAASVAVDINWKASASSPTPPPPAAQLPTSSPIPAFDMAFHQKHPKAATSPAKEETGGVATPIDPPRNSVSLAPPDDGQTDAPFPSALSPNAQASLRRVIIGAQKTRTWVRAAAIVPCEACGIGRTLRATDLATIYCDLHAESTRRDEFAEGVYLVRHPEFGYYIAVGGSSRAVAARVTNGEVYAFLVDIFDVLQCVHVKQAQRRVRAPLKLTKDVLRELALVVQKYQMEAEQFSLGDQVRAFGKLLEEAFPRSKDRIVFRSQPGWLEVRVSMVQFFRKVFGRGLDSHKAERRRDPRRASTHAEAEFEPIEGHLELVKCYNEARSVAYLQTVYRAFCRLHMKRDVLEALSLFPQKHFRRRHYLIEIGNLSKVDCIAFFQRVLQTLETERASSRLLECIGESRDSHSTRKRSHRETRKVVEETPLVPNKLPTPLARVGDRHAKDVAVSKSGHERNAGEDFGHHHHAQATTTTNRDEDTMFRYRYLLARRSWMYMKAERDRLKEELDRTQELLYVAWQEHHELSTTSRVHGDTRRQE